MPLTKIQSDILRLVAAHRDPESYVAGSTPLNVNAPRYSGEIDVFHDREERVARAAQEDSAVLEANGFNLQWLRREPTMYAVVAEKDGETTKLEWAVDADDRFFPTMQDETFGYVLHPVDLATNKVLAAAGRREPRDLVDLLTIHVRILPLGAVVWAAVGKSLGLTPEGLINEVRRLGRYTRWPRITGAISVDQGVGHTHDFAQGGAFSQRDTVGCEQRSVPLSGNRPQASLKPGSQRRWSRSSASS